MRCKQVRRCCFSATELCLTCDSLRRLCLPVCWFAELREKKKKNIDNKLEHRPFLWSRNSVQYLLEGLIGMSCILWTMVVCVSYHSSLWLDKWPVGSIHFVIETAGVAEVVAVAVPAPQRGWGSATVHAFATLWKQTTEIVIFKYEMQI